MSKHSWVCYLMILGISISANAQRKEKQISTEQPTVSQQATEPFSYKKSFTQSHTEPLLLKGNSSIMMQKPGLLF